MRSFSGIVSLFLYLLVLFLFSQGAAGQQAVAVSATPLPSETPTLPPAKVHAPDWIVKHGPEFVKNREFCKACHSPDLSGGFTGIKCDLCHLMPAHPPDWKGVHGEKFLENKTQCTLCHGKDLFAGTKQPYTMNCTRCHSVNTDVSRWQPESQTSQVYLNFAQTAQMREDRFSKREMATNSYAGFHLSEHSRFLNASSQFRFTREWLDEETNNFDLYEAYLEMDNLWHDKMDLKLGRRGFGSAVDYYLMDGADLTLKVSKLFNVAVYTGVPRYIESEDLSGDLGLVSGLSLRMKEINYTKAKIDLTYQKNDLSANGWNQTDKMYVSSSVSKGISIFKLYGLGEYDLTDTLPIAVTGGAEIYPFVKKLSFLLEGSYFDESRNDDFDSVFTIFSMGALWQGRTGFAINTVRNLSISDYFSFQRYEVLTGLHKNGFNNNAGISYFFEKIRLETALNYYFYNSYGGVLHGFSASLYEEWTNAFFTRAFVDYLTYTKVTNNDGNGFNAILEAGLKFFRQFWFSAAGEYAKNNVLQNDWRGTVRFNYSFDRKFLEFEKQKVKK